MLREHPWALPRREPLKEMPYFKAADLERELVLSSGENGLLADVHHVSSCHAHRLAVAASVAACVETLGWDCGTHCHVSVSIVTGPADWLEKVALRQLALAAETGQTVQ